MQYVVFDEANSKVFNGWTSHKVPRPKWSSLPDNMETSLDKVHLDSSKQNARATLSRIESYYKKWYGEDHGGGLQIGFVKTSVEIGYCG